MKSNPPTAILIGNSCRALAWSAHHAGLKVIACDDFHDRDLLEVAVPVARDSIEHILREYPQAYFLAAGGCEHQVERLLAWARQGEWKWAGVQAESYTLFRNLELLERLSGYAGVKLPTSDRFEAGMPIEHPEVRALRESTRSQDPGGGTERWLLKPVQSGGGQGIEWFTEERHGEKASRDVVVQAYCLGRSLSVVYWGTADGVFVCPPMESITDRHAWFPWSMAPSAFSYAGSVGPVAVSDRVRQQFAAWGQVMHTYHPWQGWLQTDWIVDDSENSWLLEVNPRWSQSMELLESCEGDSACDRSSAGSWVRNLLEGRLPTLWGSHTTESGVGKLILYADREMVVGEKAGRWMWEGRWNRGQEPTLSLLNSPVFADIPALGSLVPPGAPICSVLLPLKKGFMLEDFVSEFRKLLLC